MTRDPTLALGALSRKRNRLSLCSSYEPTPKKEATRPSETPLEFHDENLRCGKNSTASKIILIPIRDLAWGGGGVFSLFTTIPVLWIVASLYFQTFRNTAPNINCSGNRILSFFPNDGLRPTQVHYAISRNTRNLHILQKWTFPYSFPATVNHARTANEAWKRNTL
jgi:hypothetical protein